MAEIQEEEFVTEPIMLDSTAKELNNTLAGIKASLDDIAEQEKAAADAAADAAKSAEAANKAVQQATAIATGMRIENGMMCMVFTVPDETPDNAE